MYIHCHIVQIVTLRKSRNIDVKLAKEVIHLMVHAFEANWFKKQRYILQYLWNAQQLLICLTTPDEIRKWSHHLVGLGLQRTHCCEGSCCWFCGSVVFFETIFPTSSPNHSCRQCRLLIFIMWHFFSEKSTTRASNLELKYENTIYDFCRTCPV